MNGRYGTVQVNTLKNLENDEYANIREQLPEYSYLYDALFIKDEESYIDYGPSQKEYPVRVTRGSYGNKKVYEGNVKLKIPMGLNIFRNANADDDIYLVSDDTTDADGGEIIPVIYICPVREFEYAFDLQNTDPGKGIEDPEDPTLYAQDVAQWCANYIKGACIDDPIGSHPEDPDLDRDQYWMETIRKKIENGDGTTSYIEVPGRPRETASYSEAVVDENTFDEVLSLAGKPSVITYQNFIRKLSININCVKWVKGESKIEEERQKRTLPLMHTNLRLVIVHNYK